jgi:hypothetical protein
MNGCESSTRAIAIEGLRYAYGHAGSVGAPELGPLERRGVQSGEQQEAGDGGSAALELHGWFHCATGAAGAAAAGHTIRHFSARDRPPCDCRPRVRVCAGVMWVPLPVPAGGAPQRREEKATLTRRAQLSYCHMTVG